MARGCTADNGRDLHTLSGSLAFSLCELEIWPCPGELRLLVDLSILSMEHQGNIYAYKISQKFLPEVTGACYYYPESVGPTSPIQVHCPTLVYSKHRFACVQFSGI